jgi:hypothetical protein
MKFHDDQYYFKVDKNVNRLHTNLTTMKSELRNFITYSGQQLVSVDIKNAQPFFSTILLSSLFYRKTEKDKNENLFNIYNISPKILFYNLSSLIMVVKRYETYGSIDIQAYKKYVTNGRIYEFISGQLGQVIGSNYSNLSRKEIKECVFTMLFTGNKFIAQAEAEPKRIFRQIFPHTYEVMKAIKRDDSTNLPLLLQRIESKLMLDRVAKRISKERPNMPIFTIHDSIVCPFGNESYVAFIIEEEANKAIRASPILKFDYWKC